MSVVVVGSSGGGAATLGHTNAIELLGTIQKELERIRNEKDTRQHGIKFALFISTENPMDSININTEIATLWAVGINERFQLYKDSQFQVRPIYTDKLKLVNEKATEIQKKWIAPAIMEENSLITGIISISSDPEKVNYDTFYAANAKKIAVTGSGGTSLATAASVHNGIHIVGAGGSVSTTTYTRAIIFAYALSNAWDEKYNPFEGDQSVKPKIGSILDSCLPSFLAICVSCKVFHCFLGTEDIDDTIQTSNISIQLLLHLLRHQALPTVCSVITATSLSPEHGSSAAMAAVVASMSCWNSVIAGLLAGYMVSIMLSKTLFFCIRHGYPATMTNIITAGFVGTFIAAMFYFVGISASLSFLTDRIRICIQSQLPPAIGFGVGCFFCYGSKVGWYHSIFLPLILIEMEKGDSSILGAVDECTLVLVSCGICTANVMLTNDQLPKRGLKINLFCGDFIEVAYPYMEQSKIVNFCAYLASGVSTAILYVRNPIEVASSAYLPLPICLLLANDRLRIAMAMFSAFSISWLGFALSFFVSKKSRIKKVD